MKSIWEWLKKSHRWLHIIGGIVIGAGSNGWYCCEYASCGVAGALELKDKLWGGQPDWIDFLLTVAGANAGYGLRLLVVSLF